MTDTLFDDGEDTVRKVLLTDFFNQKYFWLHDCWEWLECDTLSTTDIGKNNDVTVRLTDRFFQCFVGDCLP